MEDNTIQVSLGDPRIKDISEVMANKTCNKILDVLIGEDKTASEIAHKLTMPQNTIDYNIKKLLKAGLVEKADSWWSVKGKKMPTYKVSNAKIVIEPKRQATKQFLLTLGLLALATAFMYALDTPTIPETAGTALLRANTPSIEAEFATEDTATQTGVAEIALYGTDGTVQESFIETIPSWAWFLSGGLVALGLYTLTTFLSRRKQHG